MKTRLLILLLAVAAACNCQAPEKPMFGKGAFNPDGTPIEKELPETPEPEGGIAYENIKLMSFNVLVSHANDPATEKWSYRLPGIISMLKDISPDIVGLQECPESQYLNIITALTDYSGVYIPANYKNFGTCIIYKKDMFTLKGQGYRWYSDNPTTPSLPWPDICSDDTAYRTYIWADLENKEHGYKVYFYSTHFPRNVSGKPVNNQARLKCAQTMVDHASERVKDDDIVVFTGDFNCKLSNEIESFAPFTNWMKYAWQDLPSSAYDTYRAHSSFDANAPIAGAIKDSVDYIWYRNLVPLRYRTIVEPYEGVRFLSDHYPILFTAAAPYKEAATSN